MKDSQKFVVLCEALSDLVLGGERGYENMKFEDFVQLVSQANFYTAIHTALYS